MTDEFVTDQLAEPLSLGARVVLAGVSFLFGSAMFLIAPTFEKPIFLYGFAAFCIAIGISCVTKGRVRQFFGSAIGAVVFFGSIWYLMVEIVAGRWVSGSTSVLGALFFLVTFGGPGLLYAAKAKFGFVNDDA